MPPLVKIHSSSFSKASNRTNLLVKRFLYLRCLRLALSEVALQASRLSATRSSRSSTSSIFAASDSQGVIPILIDYRDLAGNLGESIDETSDDSEVTLDMNPPDNFIIGSTIS